MDDGSLRERRGSQADGQDRGSRGNAGARPGGRQHSGAESGPRGGGLLSRYGQAGAAGDAPGVGSRDGQQQNRFRGALGALTGQARRLGENIRKVTEGPRNPRAGEWKATDFDPHTLRAWDERDEVPFEVPPDPYNSAEYDAPPRRAASLSGREPRGGAASGGRGRGGASSGGRGGQGGRDRGRGPQNWDDDEWDAGWETGTWDTGWATDFRPSMEYGRSGAASDFDDSGFWAPGRGGTGRRGYEDDDALSQSLSTLAALGAVGRPMGRVERVRLLMRRRPAAAAMLAFFVLGFMLACCAPLIPVLRLGYDALDASKRVNNIQAIFAGGTSSLLNGAKLQQAKSEVDGITHDLYEINSAMNIAGAPLAAVSPAVRNYRLLTRIGFDLTAAADEGIDVAQTLLVPIEGGALSSSSTTPGITTANIQQAQSILVDASARVRDALSAYAGLDVGALPGILQPSGKYGKYLGLLPTAQGVLNEMSTLMGGAAALLGVGQPAYYLVVLMDRSELRPGGGFQGNYGILTLEGGKQSAQHPLQFDTTYQVDTAYFDKLHSPYTQYDCSENLDQPPQYYWWWPYRINDVPNQCTFNWGMRDANLSPDFPQNALTDMQIVQDAGEVSQANPHAQLQGEIAFTPVLAEDLMAKDVLGPITVPGYGVYNAGNIEHEIHESKLGASAPTNGDSESFTKAYGKALLAKLKTAKGETLKKVLGVVEKDLKDKELELYLRDPNAELVLQQLGLASTVNQSGSDGFFVVDTNFGGNKANTYVTEDQTDVVTLLPDGGALHHLRIAVNYAMAGAVYDGTEEQKKLHRFATDVFAR